MSDTLPPPPPPSSHQPAASQEDADTVVKIASFCFPLIGIIAWVLWRESKPVAAKSVCNWALASVAISFVLGFMSTCASMMAVM